MSDTWMDVTADMAISDLHDEAVMKRATQEQSIFLFVEGDSEEVALPILFTDILDIDLVGVKIANYNGHGNLRAALRLLKLTLSHDRPIIVTYDNDPESLYSVCRCKNQGLINDLTYLFPIPRDSIVTYSNGHKGGSFEESFQVEAFKSAAFGGEVLPDEITSQQELFESTFDQSKPWLHQLRRFAAGLGFTDWTTCKPKLAEAMAMKCDDIPQTYSRLISLIQDVRNEHPVVHPDDVELPKIPGLTCPSKRKIKKSDDGE